ncbi:MAG: endonuclease/exonuclease/phosphatase family protein [Flavobacteriaceae bacterium]|nr:endonuclease/exonuclease/phosphatase family protein [Bacteroidia bacterium]NNF75815.1 endonuclease/exonuclease/phosphatase family protein [Flavobacteriaceae bacterium]NNK71650.1 endonuclease/exonuclease/phosphatase family protein [Flavobacteriaceae bacterium]
MKGLHFFDRVVFLINSIAAALLLFSYILPYVSPRNFAALSVLSLTVPLLLILNVLFLVYWLLKVKKQVLLSLFVLLVGFSYLGSLYKFSSSKKESNSEQLAVMSYNVRLFNVYNWIEEEAIGDKIMRFIQKENPDVISFQEYHPDKDVNSDAYPFKYEKLSGQRMQHGQAIWSKYPFSATGSIEFRDTANNAIYADIVRDGDTIRIYNVHLQSSGINPGLEPLKDTDSKRLLKRASETFRMQQEQAEQVVIHMQASPHKVIVCGDFNNTAYSYVYNVLKGERTDNWESAGNGFGRTFLFKYFPVRIDFILSDPEFTVDSFRTYDVKLSDHFPVLSKLSLTDK